jgi:steroid delta-isomerase-like uncharacterized protein
MSLEDNKALVRYLFDAIWNQGNTTLVDQCVSPDWIAYGNLPRQEMPGLEGVRRFITTYRTAFPDMHLTIEDQVAEGEKVVTRWTARAIHSGPLMSIPPTGRQVTVSGIGIHRIVDGKILEQWGVDDTLGMLQQLGVIPPPEQISV